MKSKKMMAVVFGNTHDHLLGEMTEQRAISSLPFGGRYRLIDFSLSNLVNADISRVAVVTKYNYKSLMDHIESGKSWDLARKHGGLVIIPPNSLAIAGLNETKVRSLAAILDFIDHSPEENILLCDGDVVSNIDIKAMFKAHVENNADITIAYKNGSAPDGKGDVMRFCVEPSGKISEITLVTKHTECDFSLDIMIMSKKLLRELIENAVSHNYSSFIADVIQPSVNTLNIYGYEIKSSAFVIDSIRSYIDANMALLKPEVRKELFSRERQVYTKIRSEMPAKYGLDSHVENSLISDGCIIEGTVENSILFRGVKVGKGSVVRNCILMQSTEVGENSTLDHVCTDKDVKIGNGRTLSGSEIYTVYIRKGGSV